MTRVPAATRAMAPEARLARGVSWGSALDVACVVVGTIASFVFARTLAAFVAALDVGFVPS